jgi:lipooligosaccharide transport system permease protein
MTATPAETADRGNEPPGRDPARNPSPQGERLRRIEWDAITGVMMREVINFGAAWKQGVFASTVQPVVYLLAFGLGFGQLVDRVDGHDYIDYVSTGTVATAVLFSTAFNAMFGSFVKREFQRTYDAILSTPVDVEELVTAEVLWLAVRGGLFGSVPILVGIAFGLDPAWTTIFVPFVAMLTGFGFAASGTLISAVVRSIDDFSYVTSALFTPLFLVAGTFFPLTGLPLGFRILAEVNPLHHCVELVRDCTFGDVDPTDLARVGALVLFAALMWWGAVDRTRKRLIA